jgi:hypothetical protein
MNGFAPSVRAFVAMAEPVSTHEVAHAVAHSHHDEHPATRKSEWIEIVEAALLAVVAVATAWSGFQAAKWDGQQASLYSLSSKYRVQADSATTLSGQQRLYDNSTFGFWLQAKATGRKQEQHLFERRFRPEYRVAFNAWMALDPFNNPKAPPGPMFMPQYQNAQAKRAVAKNVQATSAYEAGTAAREKGDKYLRNTVLLATVLFLTALAQKFRFENVRIGLLVVCTVLLVVGLVFIVTFPRA